MLSSCRKKKKFIESQFHYKKGSFKIILRSMCSHLTDQVNTHKLFIICGRC